VIGSTCCLAVATLAAPTAAAAGPAEKRNAVWWVSGAVLEDDETKAYISVIYECAADTEAVIAVHLTQSDTSHGVTATTVECTGDPDLLTLQIESVGDPWRIGHAAATMDITGNSGDRDQLYTVTVREAVQPGAPVFDEPVL
jgi:hypothetical protein